MKTYCEVCVAAPAAMLSVADHAVMCKSCDRGVHSANNAAEKQERVAFKAGPSTLPKCDICQSKPVYICCKEDRAFLCRSCDISIHSANEHVKKHARFLIAGVTLELDAVKEEEAGPSGAAEQRAMGAERNPASGSPHNVTTSNDFALAQDLQAQDLLVPCLSNENLLVPDASVVKKAHSKKRKANKADSRSSEDYAVPQFQAHGAMMMPLQQPPQHHQMAPPSMFGGESSFMHGDLTDGGASGSQPVAKAMKESSSYSFLDEFLEDLPMDVFDDSFLVPNIDQQVPSNPF